VGQSVNIDERRTSHFYMLKGGYHYNEHLRRSFLKYGETAFEFRVLEVCDENMLDVRERAWIEYYNSTNPCFGYNKRTGGQDTHHPSEETLLKMSEANINSDAAREHLARMHRNNVGRKHTAEARRKIAIANSGKKHSEDRIRKMAEALRGRKLPPRSDEWRRNMSQTQMGHKVSEETKRKISEAQKGRKAWNKGQKSSLDSRIKLSLSKQGQPWSPVRREAYERNKLKDAQ